MDVSENSGTPKSSILIGFSIINHPFWGTTIFGNTHICAFNLTSTSDEFESEPPSPRSVPPESGGENFAWMNLVKDFSEPLNHPIEDLQKVAPCRDFFQVGE